MKKGKKKKKTFGVPEGFEDGFVSQGVLATLHDEGKPVVDALMSLLLQGVNNCENAKYRENEIVKRIENDG